MTPDTPSTHERIRTTLTRNRLRLLFAVVIVLTSAYLAAAAATGTGTVTENSIPEAPPTDNHTVVTESGREGTITAYRPDGSVLYFNDTYTKYFDVDPVEGDPLTVEYAATVTIHSQGPTCEDPPCAKNIFERADLRTGETEVLYEYYEHKETAGEWHDVDRINDTHVVVADIADHQVFVVNTDTEIITWTWTAQSDFPVEEGGPFPRDWAHINDVEVLEDGRFMVSLRNQDQVVFIDPAGGLEEEWTLGAEDDHDVMYEQHNPDFIPEANGGPAVVVSDSENGEVEEFQREDGEWVQTWRWTDDRMQWPRDADRLPNGNTLVTDTHGNRVMEIEPGGDVVWEVESSLPYEAERLETGDESTGGRSASELGYESRSETDGSGGTVENGMASAGSAIASATDGFVRWLLPARAVNGLLFVSPAWMEPHDLVIVAAMVLTGLAWIALETRWQLHARGVRFRWPVTRKGDPD